MYFIQLLIMFAFQQRTLSLWKRDQVTACPLVCTCRVELFTETSIRRFIKPANFDRNRLNMKYDNEVFNDGHGTEEYSDGISDASSDLIHTAICVLQTETDVVSLLDQLPATLESLILIQGTDAGNKTLRTSHLSSRFQHLRVLELRTHAQIRDLRCIIDEPLPGLIYANFEYAKLMNGRRSGLNSTSNSAGDTVGEEVFQYTQPLDNGKSLTFVQRNVDILRTIVPYAKYKREAAHAPITWAGFDKLRLLRITHAQLYAINYDMFAGLGSLHHLLLQDNDLRIIPEFAFYGTPNLKSLSLAGNNLLTIRIADLAGLMQLEHLDLARNNFTELSELSLPPFPQLKLVNFADNPIGIIYPNTFEVLNTTKSVIVGGIDMPLKLMSNAFAGLSALQKLTVLNLRMDTLERDVFIGMPALLELHISSGYISHIAFDTFVDCKHLERLVVSGCHIYNVSVDAFLGLSKLRHLDLSGNYLDKISAATFDGLDSIREIYLSNNRLRQLPADLFANGRPTLKVVRLDGNPWYCTCAMIELRPTITNRIRVVADTTTCTKHLKHVSTTNDVTSDEDCNPHQHQPYRYKYVYDASVAPRCAEPRRYMNLTVFHAMRKMHCQNYTPKALLRRLKMRRHKARFSNDLSAIPDSKDTAKNNQNTIHTALAYNNIF